MEGDTVLAPVKDATPPFRRGLTGVPLRVRVGFRPVRGNGVRPNQEMAGWRA